MNSSPNQVDPTDSVPPVLRDSFHESVRSGDIERLVQVLAQEPHLSQAQTREQETPLLLASVHPDAHKAVEMIDLLMENGAVLHWNELLYACHHGVEWIVVRCLLKWNDLKGGKGLDWYHFDRNGSSPLLWACVGGHPELALRMLDEVDMEEHMYSTENHSFAMLEQVIKFGNEAHALAIAEHPKIQAAIRADYKGVRYDGYSLHTCVAYAVKREMASVLRLLDQLNHPTVSEVTWSSIFETSKEREETKTTNPVILGIADQFEKDQRWGQVKGLFLLRYRGQDVEIEQNQLRAALLKGLPDHLFRFVVEFIKPRTIKRPGFIDVDDDEDANAEVPLSDIVEEGDRTDDGHTDDKSTASNTPATKISKILAS